MAIKKYYVTVEYDGATRWYKDSKCTILHRTDGPALEWSDGKVWYQDGKYHRTDGPAIEYTIGCKFWYQNGLLHRIDGPAIEWENGTKEWYINDTELSEAEFLAATQPTVEMTVADIEKIVGKRVKIVK